MRHMYSHKKNRLVAKWIKLVHRHQTDENNRWQKWSTQCPKITAAILIRIARKTFPNIDYDYKWNDIMKSLTRTKLRHRARWIPTPSPVWRLIFTKASSRQKRTFVWEIKNCIERDDKEGWEWSFLPCQFSLQAWMVPIYSFFLVPLTYTRYQYRVVSWKLFYIGLLSQTDSSMTGQKWAHLFLLVLQAHMYGQMFR